jgi:hypothetical protein
MRRILVLVVTVAVAAGVLGAPVQAKKVKPVKTTLYFHGTSAAGEADSLPIVNDVNLKMDPQAPEGSEPKSKQIINGVATPNGRCAGNNFFPLWQGDVAGKIVGDVKVTFGAVSSPGQVLVRVWPDVFGSMCDSTAAGTEDYPDPARELLVDVVGPGMFEVVLEGKPFTATTNMIVQLSPAEQEVAQGESIFLPAATRILYDSADYPSNVEFNCIPAKGKSCTP